MRKLLQMRLTALTLSLMLFALTGWSQVLNENFSYTAATLLSANGWTAHSSAGINPVGVVAPTISYAGYLSSGIGNEVAMVATGEDVHRTFAAQTGPVVYASFLVNVSAATLAGDYFFHVGAATIGTNFKGRVFVKKDASDKLAFGISQSTTTTINYSGFNYDLGTTYLIVLRHTIVAGAINDVSAIYINPTLNAAEPTTGWLVNTDASGTDLIDVGSVALRQGGTTTGAILRLDGIRVSTLWSEIVGAAGGSPTINVSPTALSGFSYNVGSGPSAEQPFTVSGSDLTANVSIVPPTNYEISTTTGGAFVATNPINLAPSGGTLASNTIYVRLKSGLAANTYNNEIINITSTGATAKTVTCSGTVSAVVTEPANHATAFEAVANSSTQITVSWVDAAPAAAGYLIKGSATSYAAIANPVDGVAETDGLLVKNIAAGVQTFQFSTLTPGTTYFFKIFPYNGAAATINYKTDGTVPQASAATTTPPPTTVLQPGDIAIIGYATDAPDRFAFVTFVDILASTQIVFTDNAWTGTALTSNENTGTYTAPAGGLTKGSVITVTDPGTGTTSTVTGGGTFESRLSGLSTSGDQIIAYQGTATSPQFVTALSTTPWITTGTLTTNISYLPTGLTNNLNAIDFSAERDNGFYSGVTTGNASALGLAINNPLNWTLSDDNQVWPSWVFNVTTGTNQLPQITNIIQTPSANITPTTTVSVSANVTDPDGSITSVVLNWGLASGSLPNNITMALGAKNGTYTTSTPIPAQANGSTVYYKITATDNAAGTSSSSESSYTVAAPATQLAFVNFPATAQQGTNLTSFTVEARNASNVLVTNYTGAITLSKATGTGIVSGTLTKNAVAGVATFNDIQIDQPGAYTLNANATGLTQAVSLTINITPGPALTEILIPQFIQGATPTNADRIPFAYRVQLNNLLPNATYRYNNQIIISTDLATSAGAGNTIYVNANNTFTRTTSPSLSVAGGYGEFVTNAQGSYIGWFMNETTGNARFTPGNDVFFRIRLNDGNNGTTAVSFLTTSSSAKVLSFGAASIATNGTAIRAESNADPKNFIFLYDNVNGTGRPLYGSSIETTGIDFSASTLWAAFYLNNVAGNIGAWGAILPNINSNGLRLVQERKLADGSIASSRTSVNGMWGTFNTSNPTGGTANVIVLDLKQLPSLTASPTTLSNFSYTAGQGPSTAQSFVVSGSNLLENVSIVAPTNYELSLTNAPAFEPTSFMTLAASGGILNNTTIFVRLKAGLPAGTYNGESVFVASTGADSKAVVCNGTVVAGVVEPVNHATAFTATAPTFSQVTVNFAAAVPTVAGYIVKGSSVSFASIASPVDGVAEANSILVQNITSGTTHTFNGLNSSTTYYFKIFPFNGSGTSIDYKVDGSVPQAFVTTPVGPSLTERILPRYMQGLSGTNNFRIPYAFRATLSGLTANATFRYINSAVVATDSPTDAGAGNPIFVSPTGTFTRTTSASFVTAGQYGEFTTDASGSYTGWFMIEATGNARFAAGGDVFMRIRLNNGAGGTTAVQYFTTQAVTVLTFATTADLISGTAIRATSNASPKNFAFLYGENAHPARPLAGTSIEVTGVDFASQTTYPSFYRTEVAGVNGAWGTIIPNMNNSGIRTIEVRSLSDGSVVTTRTSADGVWGTTPTANPTGGLTNVLVLDLDQSPSLTVAPTSLSGFTFTEGLGPSAIQSFTLSGSNLTAAAVVTAPASYEISLGTGSQFVATSSLQINAVSGSIANTPIYVRLKAGLAAGTYNQTISIASSGAATKSVAVNGSVIAPTAEPVNHVTNFAINVNSMTQLTAIWGDVGAGGYIIKGSTVSFAAIAAPVDGVVETDGLLVKNIASGVQTAVFTGLNAATQYYFKIFPYNGAGSTINYKTDGNVPQASASTQGEISMTSIAVPRFMQGLSGTNNSRLPYAFRISLHNLKPNSTYRYINQAVSLTDVPTEGGAGNPIYVNGTNFFRSTNPGFTTVGQFGEFLTDGTGSYAGWFILEPTGNARFAAGSDVAMRIRLNNGSGGTTAAHYFTTEAITVLNFGTTADGTSGTAIRATSSAAPKNFTLIYDNVSGSGRPLYGTSIETTGIDFATNTAYPAFYREIVAQTNGSWGGIVPNVNALGIRRIEERSLSNGNIISSRTASDGYWGVTNTANPTGGLTNIIVLNLTEGQNQGTISGQLKYFNAAETAMPTNIAGTSFYVQLFENNVAVRPRQLVRHNLSLNLPAYFEFTNIEAGRSYTLRMWEQTQNNLLSSTWAWNNWGGVSAVDALVVSFMTVDNPIVQLFPWIVPVSVPNYSHFAKNVADANNSNTITGVDALMLQYRLINTANYNPFPGGKHNFQIAGAKVTSHTAKQFPQAPSFMFTPNGVYEANAASSSVYYDAVLPTLESGLNIMNVYFAATGDMNASYVPSAGLRTSSVLEFGSQINTKIGDEITIPVRLEKSINAGAITLGLNYNNRLIKVTDVEGFEMKTINHEKGEVSLVWFNREGRLFESGSTLINIKAIVIGDINPDTRFMELKGETEFASVTAQIIQDVQLKTNAIETGITGIAPQDELNIGHRSFPNPFKEIATIQYVLPAAGKVKVVVYNQLGQVVTTIVNQIQAAGQHTATLRNDELSGHGVYFYHIILENNTATFASKGTIVLTK